MRKHPHDRDSVPHAVVLEVVAELSRSAVATYAFLIRVCGSVSKFITSGTVEACLGTPKGRVGRLMFARRNLKSSTRYVGDRTRSGSRAPGQFSVIRDIRLDPVRDAADGPCLRLAAQHHPDPHLFAGETGFRALAWRLRAQVVEGSTVSSAMRGMVGRSFAAPRHPPARSETESRIRVPLDDPKPISVRSPAPRSPGFRRPRPARCSARDRRRG